MWKWSNFTELYHHGILGMKWGKKNGPPYPLALNKHSSSEKRAGWQNSLNKSSQPASAGGGGGGGKEDEDEKILKDLYEALEEEARRLKTTPMEMISSQNFGLTLAEQTGAGDNLSQEDIERLRKKAFSHYSKNKFDLINNTAKYLKEEKALKEEKEKKSAPESGKKYVYTDRGLVKEDDLTPSEKLKYKIFGGNSVTFDEAKLTSEEQSSKKSQEDLKRESAPEPGKKYIYTDRGLVKEDDLTTGEKLKYKIFGGNSVTFDEAKLIGEEQVSKNSNDTLDKSISEYKTDSSLKEKINKGKNWIKSKFN